MTKDSPTITAEAVEAVRSPVLSLADGIAHGFMTRKGGVSTGAVAGLQCGYGADDDQASVAENRRRAAHAIAPGAELVSCYQIHSAKVAIVDQPWPLDQRPQVDALVSDRPGIVLGIVTADCAPILLGDSAAGVIGAAHAGWRGAKAGVIEATVDAMVSLGAERANIVAGIGPCIAQPSYEVDQGFRDQFGAQDERYFSTGRPGHFHFDLPAFCMDRLALSKVGQYDQSGLDTYTDSARFYSFRRATHKGAATYGRQLSLIALA